MVLKPAEQTPLTALELARIAEEAGLPDGRPQRGHRVRPRGRRAAAHPSAGRQDLLHRLEGRRQAASCAPRADQLKRVTLELGGKSPNIVFADAPSRRPSPAPATAIFGNQGEVCSAGSRVFVERAIYDDALQAMVEHAADDPARQRPRPGDDDGAARQRRAARAGAAATSTIGDGEGAGVGLPGRRPDDPALAGGLLRAADDLRGRLERPAHRPRGDLRPGHDRAAVRRRSTRSSRLANDTEYGLAAAIWTGDITKALRTARAVRAGVVWINDSQPAPSESLWGGFKQSGIGPELGPYALDAYLETKQIYINLS